MPYGLVVFLNFLPTLESNYSHVQVSFPVTIAAAQVAYYLSAALGINSLLLRPFALNLSSYNIVQSTYIGLGVFSFLTHLPLLFGIVFTWNPLEAAWDQLVPRMRMYVYETKEEFRRVGMRNEIKRFLQWDHIMIALATWLAGTWSWAFATPALAARVVSISLAGSFVMGPGVVVAAVFMVKEAGLQHARTAVVGAAAGRSLEQLHFIVETVQRALIG